MFAGQIELDSSTNTGYFYWKFEDRDKLPDNNHRTTFWLNGGPGCSSMDGALLESGPFRINDKKEITYNSGSWHKLSDMVYVDQPAGTGFSYTDDYRHDLDQIADDFLVFLEKYFEIFPEDKENDLYLSGESYAGQYIPYIARAMLNSTESYKLKGLLIGNGWISPNEQSLSDVEFAMKAKLIDHTHPNWLRLMDATQKCQQVVNEIDSTFDDGEIHDYETSSSLCENLLNIILSSSRDPSKPDNEQCINMYDYTLKDTYPQCGSNWPNELAYVTPFLNLDDVQSNLNLKNKMNWVECNGKVGRFFKARNSIPAIHLLPELTEKVSVVLFHGNLDIICNYIGAESMIKKLKWGGKRGFSEDIEAKDWVYEDETVGYIKSESNLTFINIFNASHMVPYDQPEVSRALIDLITGKYDTVDNKIITKSIERKEEQPGTPETEKPKNENQETPETDKSEEPESEESKKDQNSGSKISRLIQFLVIAILIWGVYVLYVSYKSRPVSIIKSKPNTKKKNVQWADQLRRFQEEDDDQIKNKSFFSKTIGKFTVKNKYTPIEDFELNENPNVDDFIIDSEDETEAQTESNKPLPSLPSSS